MHRDDATTLTEKEFRRLCGHGSKTKVNLKTRLLEKIKNGLTKILKLIFNQDKFDPLTNKKRKRHLFCLCVNCPLTDKEKVVSFLLFSIGQT